MTGAEGTRCFIRSVELENFRCFGRIHVNFHDQLTVLVAPNGGGKTAVLEAVAGALRVLIKAFGAPPLILQFPAKDVRRVVVGTGQMEPTFPVGLGISFVLFGGERRWEFGRTRPRGALRAGASSLASRTHFLPFSGVGEAQWFGFTEPSVLPLIAYYGTGRLWGNGAKKASAPAGDKGVAVNSRLLGYEDSLSPSARFTNFLDWFRRYSYESQREQATGTESAHKPAEMLAAVRQAVDIVLAPSGWHDLQWDYTEETPTAAHSDHGRLPISMLSDGIRTMIGLVADAAHRCARLNRQFGGDACLRTPGIVLIDEVDMHLHPEWQQVVVDGLLRAFPLMQFIVTTHSPQVLTTLRKENIRVLRQHDESAWSADVPEVSPLAKEAGDALAYIMGVNPVPDLPLLVDLHRFDQLVRSGAGDTEEALGIKQRLAEAGFEFSDAELRLHEILKKRGAATGGTKE